jgi:peptidoglycan/LPS O-acetylase OafA/YrhL
VSSRRIIALDALRGVLALIVVLHHVTTLFSSFGSALVLRAPLTAEVVGFISRRNVEAVICFFVLSGLSIRLSVERHALTEPGATTTYLYRRARRILPLYWLALALAALVVRTLAPVPTEAASLRTLLLNLVFLQTAVGVPGLWVLPYAGNGPLWSLSFEMFFYLCYPALVRGVRNRTRRTCLVLGLTVFGLLLGVLWPNPFAMFCAASLIWYVGVELAELSLGARASLPWPVFALLWLLLCALRMQPWGATVHGLWIACTLLLMARALLPLLRHARPKLRVLNTLLLKPLAHLGTISYGLYVLHVPILRACAAGFGSGFLSALGAVTACVGVAFVAERCAARMPSHFRRAKRDVS